MAIDFQGLLAVAKATENHPNIQMSHWKCGTACCMIGSFCDANEEDSLYLTSSSDTIGAKRYIPTLLPTKETYTEAIAKRFGITTKEADWLFTRNPLIRFSLKKRKRFCSSAEFLFKDDALARLYKFIYYKLHKQEMNYEVQRKISGMKSAQLAQKVTV